MNTSFACVKDDKLTARILFIVAGIQAVIGGLYGWFYGSNASFGFREWLFVAGAPIYVLLGLGVRWLSFGALVMGFILYSYLVLDVHALPEKTFGVWQDGMILKVPVFILLLWGLTTEDEGAQGKGGWKNWLSPIFIESCKFILLGMVVCLSMKTMAHLQGMIADVVYTQHHTSAGYWSDETARKTTSDFIDSIPHLLAVSYLLGCVLGGCVFAMCLVLIRLFVLLFKKSGIPGDLSG